MRILRNLVAGRLFFSSDFLGLSAIREVCFFVLLFSEFLHPGSSPFFVRLFATFPDNRSSPAFPCLLGNVSDLPRLRPGCICGNLRVF